MRRVTLGAQVKTLMVIALVALLTTGCAGLGTSPEMAKKDTVYKLTILHTNDHHGRFWKDKYDQYGQSARKTMIDSIRKEVAAGGGHVLLLDAGDINTGVPESDMLQAEPDIKAMNMLGYDAMTVGNHEFDNTMETLRKQESWMKFPMLSSNVFDKKTGNPLFKSSADFNLGGLAVTVVGFTTEDTKKQGNPENIGGLRFVPVIDQAAKIVPKLRKKSDVLIALTHMGYYKDGNHGGNAPGSVSLARAVPGIDVIVDGHTHERLTQPDVQNGTLIVQAEDFGKYLGRLDLEFLNGKVTKKSYRLIPINLKKKIKKDGKKVRVLIEEEIAEDPETLAMLGEYQEMGQKKLNVIIGSSNGKFIGERKIIRNNETNLGNLLCAAAIAKTDADLSAMNSGGIRTDIAAGDITYKDVLQVNPFGNTLCTVEMTGKELKSYLEVVAGKAKDTGAFAQFMGVEITLEKGKLTKLMIKGAKAADEKTYKLALLSYIASGGDGYPKVSDHRGFVDTGYVDADVLKEYISKNSPLRIEDYAPTGDVVVK